MATRIRLRRMGRKKHPTYRIVVADRLSPRDGKYIEAIGRYGPKEDPAVLEVDKEAALKWIGQGATATETVRALLKRAGVFDDSAPATEAAPVAQAPVAAEEAAAAEEPAPEAADTPTTEG